MEGDGSIGRLRQQIRQRLLGARGSGRHWEGRLSSSALATATALFALHLARDRGFPTVEDRELDHRIERALRWLADQNNPDGGWGDTIDSPSNISTTALVWAALHALAPVNPGVPLASARAWVQREVGSLDLKSVSSEITERYGEDRTFAVPILTMCALSGCLGEGRDAWSRIPQLPFELALLPHRLFKFLGLPVVSYALPALIAIGQAQHGHRPSSNPFLRHLRKLARGRTLKRLDSIQPPGGGFLEAIPLTAFVCMSLLSLGHYSHPVVRRGLRFILASQRDDGSWPIDSNLSCWLTSLTVQALSNGGRLCKNLPAEELKEIAEWLLQRQYRVRHPYTQAPAGGWSWTHLSGGVPDADDTSSALLALRQLVQCSVVSAEKAEDSARAGLRWLLQIQNRDGGIPTFCRGWGKLEFDRSAPDLTAHAVRAWEAWYEASPSKLRKRLKVANRRAIRYLLDCQKEEGCWVPLWFGNQSAPAQQNPVYGTSRVLLAQGISTISNLDWPRACRRGCEWLISVQNSDGGWGAAAGVDSSVEESAWALEALALGARENQALDSVIIRGCRFLDRQSRGGECFEPASIGLYFARLWYSEELYPLVFSMAALERLRPRDSVQEKESQPSLRRTVGDQ